MRSCLALILVGSICWPALAQSKEDFALRARAILRKNCGECHGEAPKFGTLSVADSVGMTRRVVRPFVKPGSADESYLLQLVEDGSMPPGTQPKLSATDVQLLRDWINGGAPGYPKKFGSEYAADRVAKDAGKLPPEEQAFYRYLSLAHLVGDDDAPLQPRRDALRNAVRDLSKAGPEAVVGIDPPNTVFRMDLRRLGWNEQPFEFAPATEGAKSKPAPYNLFDLILLEYPNGRTYPTTQAYVSAIHQVLPVPFVEADWFAETFAKSPAGLEFMRVMKPNAALPTPLTASPPVQITPKESRLRVLPFDAAGVPNLSVMPAPFQLEIIAADPKTDKAKPRFQAGERLLINVRSSEDVWIEITATDPAGEIKMLPRQLTDHSMLNHIHPDGEEGYKLDDVGRHLLTIFAAKNQFPAGQILRDKRFQAWLGRKGDKAAFSGGFTDRFVHRFYADDFDPAAIVKKTIAVEVVK